MSVLHFECSVRAHSSCGRCTLVASYAEVYAHGRDLHFVIYSVELPYVPVVVVERWYNQNREAAVYPYNREKYKNVGTNTQRKCHYLEPASPKAK